MKLVIGLGNPGSSYENTRHNIGFMVIDNYLENIAWKQKFLGEYCEIEYKGKKVIFLKPLTYMNNSGECVSKFVNYFKIDISDILVIQDDMDLNISTFKLKKNSSSGGHNGIKSIISALKSDGFLRLKIGISHADNNINHVLGKFSKKEMEILNRNFNLYNQIIESFLENNNDKVINDFNGRR